MQVAMLYEAVLIMQPDMTGLLPSLMPGRIWHRNASRVLECSRFVILGEAGAVLGVRALLEGRGAGLAAVSAPTRVGKSSARCILIEAAGEGAAAAGGLPEPLLEADAADASGAYGLVPMYAPIWAWVSVSVSDCTFLTSRQYAVDPDLGAAVSNATRALPGKCPEIGSDCRFFP